MHQNIIVPTSTILHSYLDVVIITDFQDTPKTVICSIQAKKTIQRHPICLSDAYYYYILEVIECQDKIDLKRNVSDNSEKG